MVQCVDGAVRGWCVQVVRCPVGRCCVRSQTVESGGSFPSTSGRLLHLPPSTVMFFLGGLVLFFFGLISEQVASLRFRSPESWLTVGPARE